MKTALGLMITASSQHEVSKLHLGVTCIMPNLGGLLIQFEDRNNIQLDRDEMEYTDYTLRYVSENEIVQDTYEDYDDSYINGYVKYQVVDHRR